MIEAMVFPCTYHCDGKCIMCTIHQRKCIDLEIKTFESFFSSQAIKRLKSLNLTGGEPTLRDDLTELVEMILKYCTELQEVIINTNGLNPERVERQINSIVDIFPCNIKLWVLVSIDSVGKEADYIRGVKGAADRAKETVQKLKKLQDSIKLGISCTITSANYNLLKNVLDYAKEEDMYIDFIYATVNTAYINSEPRAYAFCLNESQQKEVAKFLENAINYEKLLSSKLYIKKLIGRLRGIESLQQCILQEGRGILLEADGTIRPCGMTNKIELGNISDYSSYDNLGKALTNKQKKFCKNCFTDSYYSWTDEAQEDMLNELLGTLKRHV